MRRHWLHAVVTLVIGFYLSAANPAWAAEPQRQIIGLNGVWEISEGAFDAVPPSFDHAVRVPGLVDMAEPAFDEVGRPSELREAFWYRRRFEIDGAVPATAVLKINKARYGTKVFLNGELVGEHLPCFTPAYLDVRAHLRGEGEENELVIRVGADRTALPEGQPGGWEVEKILYLPGIYDDVSLIMTGSPYIVNVQTVPDIETESVGLVVEIESDPEATPFELAAQVVEAGTGRVAGEATVTVEGLSGGEVTSVELNVPIADCRLWSPEDPFLYEVRLRTPGDTLRTRFGMRSFRFDPETRRAMLNGRPYYMRGTNVNVYRFFEDADRGDLPWRDDWVRRLHQTFKRMHWNSMRYCIGFPPERWYEIADEEGFLIQDEFPIWLLAPKDTPEWPTAERIIPEYTEWMRERWNHASVVIWDAQNESNTDATGEAIRAVRHLDRSNRPWDNGWSAPQSPTDPAEAHPYRFGRRRVFRLSRMPEMSPEPPLRREQQQAPSAATIINEYGWIWLGRNGEPTIYSRHTYDAMVGPDATAEERRRFYARSIAALTEYWRAHRRAAGVLHLGGLAYSRPEGEAVPPAGVTSDNFIDVEQLTLEPMFERYVGDAFNPLGVMLNFWAEEIPAGEDRVIEVYVINDRYAAWEGDVTVRVLRDGEAISTAATSARVDAVGREIVSVPVTAPEAAGSYTLVAEVRDADGQTVRSLRDFRVAGQPNQ